MDTLSGLLLACAIWKTKDTVDLITSTYTDHTWDMASLAFAKLMIKIRQGKIDDVANPHWCFNKELSLTFPLIYQQTTNNISPQF